jgi:hypothetical protein
MSTGELMAEKRSGRTSVSGGGTPLHPLSIPTPPSVGAGTRSANGNNCNGERKQLQPKNQTDILPSFNSRDMLERIEYKRLKMRAARGWDHTTSGETSPNVYPFTPKNSFVEPSTLEDVYR